MAHFDGTAPGCNIHTTRSTGPCSNAGQGHCKYRENCNALANDPWNAHHIVTVYAVNAYPDLPAYSSCVSEIDDCYRLTSWCINQPPNMIGLPLKSTHAAYSAIRALNLPAHNLDHNCTDGYTDEVCDAIGNLIWDEIKKAVDDAKNNNTHFTPAQVKSQFEQLVTDFRAEISRRGGTRSGGTAVAWGNQGSTTNFWWMPFSMAKDSVAKARAIASL
jgi:hypothetical protein